MRSAERIVSREGLRLEEVRENAVQYQEAFEVAEDGSFARRSAERRLTRAQETIITSEGRLREAQVTLDCIGASLVEATSNHAFWDRAAGYTFYLILAFVLIDAVLMLGMVRRAIARIGPEEKSGAEKALEEAETGKGSRADVDHAENWIDRLSLFCGEFAAYWAVIAVFVYYYEVVARYVFGSPTNWAHEAMYLMFGMQYMIADAYAMLTESHVRVDIFYSPLTRKGKAWCDLLTLIFFFIFAGTLLFTSYIFAMDALAVLTGNSIISDWARGTVSTTEMLAGINLTQWTDPSIRWGEISFNEWEVPLWSMKWVMVMGGLLLVLQGISKLSKDMRAIVQGAS